MTTDRKSPILKGIIELEQAERALNDANRRLHRAKTTLEVEVLEALKTIHPGDMELRPWHAPCGEEDPVSVICGSYQVTLRPNDQRPDVVLEEAFVIQ